MKNQEIRDLKVRSAVQNPNTRDVLRGGVEGRERLRLLSGVIRPFTLRLFDRLGIREGMYCLDVGCGGGDVTVDLARIVGPDGRVVGTDLDAVKLDIAHHEAEAQGLQVDFRLADEGWEDTVGRFDFVFARFVLTHVPDPSSMLRRMFHACKPSGILAVVDTDFSGYFSHPDCPALWEYVRLYSEVVKRRGGDANIGRRLPNLLSEFSLNDLQMNIFQPAGWIGIVKRLSPLTLEYVTEAVLAEKLASMEELDRIVKELYAFAEDDETLLSAPRCVEVWGRKQMFESGGVSR